VHLYLNKLAILLRSEQFYAHHAHNNCSGPTFMQDHEFFGDVYPALEGEYDSVVERMIGTGAQVDTVDLVQKAYDMICKFPKAGNADFYKYLLKLELSICITIDTAIKECKMPSGVEQLIGGIADNSMVRQYKIKQRLK
jgi:hypothetical protein